MLMVYLRLVLWRLLRRRLPCPPGVHRHLQVRQKFICAEAYGDGMLRLATVQIS